MSEKRKQKQQQSPEPVTRTPLPGDKKPWEAPRMEDVSEEVMAQPYIRFRMRTIRGSWPRRTVRLLGSSREQRAGVSERLTTSEAVRETT